MRTEYNIGIIILIFIGISAIVLLSSPQNNKPSDIASSKQSKGVPYKEIINPSGYVNTNDAPIQIKDYIGKKVVMLDIMTYSCINCQRTFPYVISWYETYKDDGFIVIGIHTPEFAFEKNKNNVEKAMKEFGIKFPVVLDNDYGTWNAYGNRYWPRKYLIDIHGNVVYDHIGEGAYEETERKIQQLLMERSEILKETVKNEMLNTLTSEKIEKVNIFSESPETYFGSLRNEYLGNGTRGKRGKEEFVLPEKINPNTLYLEGKWNIEEEYAASTKNSFVVYKYNAKKVYLVASSKRPAEIEVWQDGVFIKTISIQESKLYEVISNTSPSEHTLLLKIRDEDALLYAFTFG